VSRVLWLTSFSAATASRPCSLLTPHRLRSNLSTHLVSILVTLPSPFLLSRLPNASIQHMAAADKAPDCDRS
jgi:hypothetical protein